MVVVAPTRPRRPSAKLDAGFLGHVGERAIVVVVEQHCFRRRLFALVGVQGRTVEQVDIQPAVVVVVEQCHTGARNLNDRALVGIAGAMMKLVNPRLMCDVFEDDWRALNKTAGSNGTMLRVEHWWMCRPQ